MITAELTNKIRELGDKYGSAFDELLAWCEKDRLKDVTQTEAEAFYILKGGRL